MLNISGEVNEQRSFLYSDLATMPGQVADVGAEVAGREGRGVRLRHVLAQAGIKPGADHATLASTDGKFTASVPVADIMDALLVYALGDEPLPARLGGPVRFLIPDAAACHSGGADTCANVKFLGRIELTKGKVEDSRDRKAETPHG